jgi:hypothetical protein
MSHPKGESKMKQNESDKKELRKKGPPPNEVTDLALKHILEKRDLTLGMLVENISKELGLDKDKIVEELMLAREEKKIRIREAKPYSTLIGYATSPYAYWFWGLIAATLVSLALISVTSGL